MDLDHKATHIHHPHATFRWPNGRRRLLRKRRLPTVQLGGKKKPRRGAFLIKLFRRVRLRWLKLKYTSMLRKLKEHYQSLIKDMAEAGGTVELFQQRLLLEISFALPVMGVSFTSYPNSSYYSSCRF